MSDTQRRCRILLVEDDTRRVEMFRAWADADTHIVWTQTGGTALGLLDRDRGHLYDGILLDHDLDKRARTSVDAGIDGQQICRKIVETQSNFVPVLIHSMNPFHVPAMIETLTVAGFHVEAVTMAELTRARFEEWVAFLRENKQDAGIG